MKRLVNVRLPVLAACAQIAGVITGYFFMRNDISLFYSLALVPVAAALTALCVIFARKTAIVFGACAFLLFFAGVLGSYFRLVGFDEKEITSGDDCYISATVAEKGLCDGGEYIIVENATCDGQKIRGKIRVYLSDSYGDFCDVGYGVQFTAQLSAYDAFSYGELNYNAIKNVKYRCRVNGGLVSSYGFSLFGSVNKAIRNALYGNLDQNTASVAYAMLTGNVDGIDDVEMTAFRYGGIAHIFAVSGLHIGIVYGVLLLLCKRLRLNKFVSFAACVAPLFFYAGVCGFTPSSVRAAIMCAAAAVAKLSYAKYDALNALSLSSLIICLIEPLNVFNVGFQLSACAVGAIILLSKNLAKAVERLPEPLGEGICVSLSAQTGTMPVMLARFGYLSGAGIILNIVIVPLLSLLFAVIFGAVVIALVLPFVAKYVLPCAATPLGGVTSFLTNADFERALIKELGGGTFVPLYCGGLLALSDKFNFTLKFRLLFVSLTVAAQCVCLLIF